MLNAASAMPVLLCWPSSELRVSFVPQPWGSAEWAADAAEDDAVMLGTMTGGEDDPPTEPGEARAARCARCREPRRECSPARRTRLAFGAAYRPV